MIPMCQGGLVLMGSLPFSEEKGNGNGEGGELGGEEDRD